MTPAQAAARRVAFAAFARISRGQLVLREGAREYRFGPGTDGPRGIVEVLSPRAWPWLMKGTSGMAEAYARGYWDAPDLVAPIRLAAINTTELDAVRRRLSPLRVPFQWLRSARNTAARSAHDIAAHYDLGNDLFELMLDPTMMYSAAYFAAPGMGLEDASRAKLDLVCQTLELDASHHVLEIGAGWGGFAIHAARTRGCRVTTTTISAAQRELAQQRAREAGVADLVTVLGDDYRALEGRFDKLVSLEMIEAVGWRDFDTFFRVCSQRLRPSGDMLLQAITMDDRAYAVEKMSRSFIRTYIFPNGCLPSQSVIARSLATVTDLSLVGLRDLTPHYVQTLRAWRTNIEAHTHRLETLGYDERFRRIWRLYLAYAEAGFAERRIAVAQQHLAKPGWRATVPTRRPVALRPAAADR